MNSKLLTDPGFDIVIGNPPYVQLQKDSGKLAKDFEKCGYETFTRMGDIYSLFYEKGFNLLKKEGNLIYITSNKWMKTGYGKLTRKFFTEKTQPLILIDFAGQQIFETATVDTNILQLKKTVNRKPTKACIVEEKWKTSLTSYVETNTVESEFIKDDAWVILNPIEQKIKAKIDKYGIPLSEWDININFGIKTGYNEAFIIDEATKDKLISQDSKSAEIIRPILRGRDVKKYFFENNGLFLIYVPWHFPLNHKDIQGYSIEAEISFREDYPAIYKHLKNYKKELSSRNQMETNIRYEWYALQRFGSKYMDDFSKQKIVWSRLTRISKYNPTDFPIFFTSTRNLFVLDSLCMITGSQYGKIDSCILKFTMRGLLLY